MDHAGSAWCDLGFPVQVCKTSFGKASGNYTFLKKSAELLDSDRFASLGCKL